MAYGPAHPLTIGIVAGEAAGDQVGAHLMRALLARRRGLSFVGIGGPRMAAAGAELVYPMERLEASAGSIAALRRRREIAGIRRGLRERFRRERPALFIGMDAPDFNLDLETALKKDGVPTVQCVGPAIWDWRRERVPEVRAAVTLLLTIFPFATKAYDKAGVPVRYVGHPLADLLAELPAPEAVREELRVPLAVPVVALLPGGCAGLERMAEVFIRTAVRLQAELPDVRFLVPLATREAKAMFETALARVRPERLALTMLIGHSLEAMAAADAVLVASGTDALEAALLKRPMVIACRVSRLSWWLKPRAYLSHLGMPNLLAGEKIVPELFQDDATPEKLAQALLTLMRDAPSRAKLESRFEAIRTALRQNTAEKAPAAIMPLLGRSA